MEGHNFENGADVDMFDIEEGELVDGEEGELVELSSQNGSGRSSGGSGGGANQKQQSKKSKQRARKRMNKRMNRRPWTNLNDIDRFVIETCRHLREKKSYLMYTAVGCLGIAAVADLIKEVDAIQACGGQMTSDGTRYRNGGGVLWSIIKVREPKAYKEIMKKAKDFEKQFKQPNRPAMEQRKGVSSHAIANSTESGKGVSSHVIANSTKDGIPANDSDGLPAILQVQDNQSNSGRKHISVHDRLRVPVSYDDDLLAGEPNDDASHVIANSTKDGTPDIDSDGFLAIDTDGLLAISQLRIEDDQSSPEEKHVSVYNIYPLGYSFSSLVPQNLQSDGRH